MRDRKSGARAADLRQIAGEWIVHFVRYSPLSDPLIMGRKGRKRASDDRDVVPLPKTHFVIDESGRTVTLPRGASDAALTPYHVNRSKIFVHERLGKSPTLDADRLARAIEATRGPCLFVSLTSIFVEVDF